MNVSVSLALSVVLLSLMIQQAHTMPFDPRDREEGQTSQTVTSLRQTLETPSSDPQAKSTSEIFPVKRTRSQFSEDEIQSASPAIVNWFESKDDPKDADLADLLCSTMNLSQDDVLELMTSIRSGKYNALGEETFRAHQFLLHSLFPAEKVCIAALVIFNGCDEKLPFATIVTTLSNVLSIQPTQAQEMFELFERGAFNDNGHDALQAYDKIVYEVDRFKSEAFCEMFTSDQVRVAGDIMSAGYQSRKTERDIISEIAAQLNLEQNQANALYQGIMENIS